jgi:hypothetical protein
VNSSATLTDLDRVVLSGGGGGLAVTRLVLDDSSLSAVSSLSSVTGSGSGTQSFVVNTATASGAVFNLKAIKSVEGLDEFKIQVNDNGGETPNAMVRLSSSLTHSGVSSIVLDTTPAGPVDRLFFETDTARSLSSNVISGAANNSWTAHGLGFAQVTGFDTSVDSFGAIDSSGNTLFSTLEYGLVPVAEANSMYINLTRVGDIDNITTVRDAVAAGFTGASSGDTFGFAMFEKVGTTWDLGIFQVQWNGSSSADVVNSTDLKVLPIAKLIGVNPSPLRDPFSSGEFLASVANVSEVNSGLV